jgi:hypothetical protein
MIKNDNEMIVFTFCNGDKFNDDNCIHTAIDGSLFQSGEINTIARVCEMAINGCLDKITCKERS